MSLLILNENSVEPNDYIERQTAKAVIIDDKGNTLHLSSNLVGGGVEKGETDEMTLHREAMEEAGIEIQIIKPLGEVIAYRDVLKKKYIIRGYLCKYLGKSSAPTTTDFDELNMKIIWEKPEEAIKRFSLEINSLKTKERNKYEGDVYQSKLFNKQMALTFLLEVFKDQIPTILID